MWYSAEYVAAIIILYMGSHYCVIYFTSNEASSMLLIIVNCSIPNVVAGVRLWPFTNTTEEATITYSCSEWYWPQTNQTSLCTQVVSDGVWMPYLELKCLSKV